MERRRQELAAAAAMKKGRHWAMCREIALLLIDVTTEVRAGGVMSSSRRS